MISAFMGYEVLPFASDIFPVPIRFFTLFNESKNVVCRKYKKMPERYYHKVFLIECQAEVS
jgi:hypothetical protein